MEALVVALVGVRDSEAGWRPLEINNPPLY